MEIINELVRLFVPYIVFVAILVVFWLLYKSAKRWRGVAFAFGMLVQIFLPEFHYSEAFYKSFLKVKWRQGSCYWICYIYFHHILD